MLMLSLLRHAKSAWDDATLSDHDRPLAPRGEKAAPRMGRHIAEGGRIPDLVLCSTAVRTRQTLTLVLGQLPTPPADIRFDEALYLATPEVLKARIAALAGAARHILVVGHNPGLHELALDLAGRGARGALVQLAKKFPTGALAELTFPDRDDWASLPPGSGTLESFTTPRALV